MEQIDKDTMLRTNQYYIAQVSSMEIKISELKAQLHAKDFEIDYLASKLCPSQTLNEKSLEKYDLELQLNLALQENEALKNQIAGIEETSVLKSQLEHALYMKDLFEQKYREMNLQSIITEKQTGIECEKDEIISNLRHELEKQRCSSEEIKFQSETLVRENMSLQQEIYDRDKLIGELRKRNFQLVQASDEKKQISALSIPSPNLFFRPQSTSHSRKQSPEMSDTRKLRLRSNLQYQSPDLNRTTTISRKPKIVNISLEATMPR